MSQELKDEIKRLFDVTPEDVNSVSYGFKFKNGEKTDKLSIIFGVNQKKPLSEVKSDEVLPSEIVIDGKVYLTDVVEHEMPNLQQCYPDPADANIQRLRGNPSLLKPMRGGQEIIQFPTGWTPSGGGGYNISVGTLGFFAVDNTDNKIVGVTNSHVVCDERVYCDEQNINIVNTSPYNTCQERPWTNVDPNNDYFPGALVNDNGAVELAGYNIKRYQPVSNTDTNYVDGALLIMNNATPAYVDSNSYMVWQPIGTPDYAPYLPFATTAELDNLLVEDPPVYSTGRTTGPKGYTAATDCALKITELHVNAYVNDNGTLQYWGDCIKYAYEDGSNTPSAGGDSGSAVLADIGGTRKVIGLLFAGATAYTLLNRIDRVAETLNIRAWDASYSINLNQPSPIYKVCNLSLGYGGIDSVVLNGVTYYQAGFTLTTALPTMPPIPSNSPSPTPSPSPSPSPTLTPSFTPSPTPSPSPSPTPYVLRDTWAWGNNADGQLGNDSVVSRSSPVLVQTSGYQHVPYGANAIGALGIDGNMYAWGRNQLGQLGITSLVNKSSATQVVGNWSQASFNNTSTGIKTDGTLWAWGSNNLGACAQNSAVVNYSSPVQIGSDSNWSYTISRYTPNVMMAIKTDGTLWGAGANAFGQLGNSSLANASSIVQSGTNSNWLKVQLGNEFNIGLRTDGTIWSIGNGVSFNLGNNSTQNYSSWIQVGNANNWIDISCKLQPVLALNNLAELYVWGSGASGASGLNSTNNVQTPTLLMSNVAWFSAGVSFCAAIKSDNSLWVWGANTTGRLGLNNVLNVSSPTQVGTNMDWWGVEANFDTIQAWKTVGATPTPTPSPTPSPTNSPSPTPSPSPTGDVAQYNWGDNAQSGLGIASAINKSTPTFVSGSTWIEGYPQGGIANGGIKSDGSLWVVGYNARGCLGLSNLINRSVYTQVGSETNWSQVYLGITCGGVKNDGTLWTWGEGAGGGIGDGTVVTKSSPIQIAADKTWKSFTGYMATTVGSICGGITTSGELYMWGLNALGQLGNNTAIPASSPVQVGTASNWSQLVIDSAACMGLKTDGTLWGWGNNGVVTGIGSNIIRSTPVQVGTSSDWTQVVGTGSNFAALKSDNTAWIWGNNGAGQLADGTVVNKSVPILLSNNAYKVACGNTTTFVIKLDGTLWFAGAGTSGASGGDSIISRSSLVQTTLADNKWVHIAAGASVALGIRNSAGLATPTPTPTPT